MVKICNSCGVHPRKPGRSARYCEACTESGYPSQSRKAAQAWKFGISVNEIERMESEQGGRCAICGQVSPNGKRLAVDHDHSCCPGKRSCGKCVRGLLCESCNRGLGCFKDDPKLIESALKYLKEF